MTTTSRTSANKNKPRTKAADSRGAAPAARTGSEQPSFAPRPLPRYRSVYESLIVGVLATAGALIFARAFAIEIGANAVFLAYLIAVVVRLPRLDRHYLRRHAGESDIPALFILLIALASVAVAAVSLLILINSSGPPDHLRLALGILSVVLGWLALHTMLAFHYAYEYYEDDAASPLGTDGKRKHVAGLGFPGTEEPDGLSFLYFSFVVAMTAQVSDVVVESSAMRRLVLLHGILSFFFNTVIIAMAVNIVVALGH